MDRKRLGLIGFGFIGRQVYERIAADPAWGLDIAFVHNRSRGKLSDVPADLVLDDLGRFAERAPDLVVEASHPSITAEYGEAFIAAADYMPLSVTALADAALLDRLKGAATKSGHKLLLPHGALVGADALFEWRGMWDSVTITFRKHPRNIDFADYAGKPPAASGETVLYDGPARGIAARFPRNVNTMITCALASVGLERCRAVLIADPALDVAIAEVEAIGRDGSRLTTVKRQPAVGVSGTEMFESQFHSILRAAGLHGDLEVL